jgi:hypothetical protein
MTDHNLRVITVEPMSQLFHHLHRAWVGAHMKLALALARMPGGLHACPRATRCFFGGGGLQAKPEI